MLKTTLLFIFLSIQMTTSQQNRECILRTIQADHFRRIPKTHLTANTNNRLLSKNDDIMGGKGLDLTKRRRNFQSLTVKHYDVTEELFKKSFVNDFDGADFLVNKVCMPYMLEDNINRVPAMVFCYKFSRVRSKEMTFALENAKLGQKVLGKIFKESMEDHIRLFKREDQQSTYKYKEESSKQKYLDDLKKQIIKKYDDSFVEIKNKFDSIFKIRIKDKIIDTVAKEKAAIEFIKEELKCNDEKARKKLTAVLLPLATYYVINPKFVERVLVFIKNHPEFLHDSNDGHAMRRVGDDILSYLDNKHNYLTNWMSLKLGPVCHKVLINNGVVDPVSNCSSLLTMSISSQNSQTKKSLLLLSHSKKFLKKIKKEVKDIIEDFDTGKGETTNKLSSAVIYKVFEIVNAKVDYLNNLDFNLQGSSNEKLQLLFSDLEELMEKIPDVVKNYFEMFDVVNKFEAKAANKLYYSEEVRDYVEDLIEKILKFSKSASKIKNDAFVKKLKEKCNSNFQNNVLSYCKLIAVNVNYMRFLKLRKNDYIFDLIIMDFDKFIKTVDTDNTEKNVLEQTVIRHTTNFINELAHSLNKEGEILGKLFSIKEKKIDAIVVSAKLANQVVEKNWDEAIVPMIQDWYVDEQDTIEENKIGSEKFSISLNKLVSQIFAQHKSNELQKEVEMIEQDISQLSENDQQDLLDNINSVIINFDLFDGQLKNGLYRCKLERNYLEDVYQLCEERAEATGRSCQLHNPFVLKLACGLDATENNGDECVSNCPVGFSIFNDRFCKKPEVFIIKEETDCGSNYRRYENLCVPVCPVGWRDAGSWCQRPREAVEYFWLVK